MCRFVYLEEEERHRRPGLTNSRGSPCSAEQERDSSAGNTLICLGEVRTPPPRARPAREEEKEESDGEEDSDDKRRRRRRRRRRRLRSRRTVMTGGGE